jgi:hypothetical protein
MKEHPRSNNDVTQFIGSPFVGLVFLGLALYAQTPHTQNAFFELGHDKLSAFATGNSWAYAIALELAVLYFVVRGNFQASYIFAGVSVAMNVAYYTIHHHNMLHLGENWTRWLVSVSLPVAIAYYSHCIADADGTSFAKVRGWVVQRWGVVRDRFRRTEGAGVVVVDTHTDEEPTQPDNTPSIPDKHTRVVQLHSEGLSYKQIAGELGVHPNTVGKIVRSMNGHKEVAQ